MIFWINDAKQKTKPSKKSHSTFPFRTNRLVFFQLKISDVKAIIALLLLFETSKTTEIVFLTAAKIFTMATVRNKLLFYIQI